MHEFEIPRLIWLVIPSVAVHFVLREVEIERATLRKGLAIFPTILSFRIMFYLAPPMFLYAAYQISKTANGYIDWFLVGFMAVVAVGSIWIERGTIRVTDDGVFFRRWYGLKKCEIPWKDVRSAVSAKVPKTITVFSRDGRSIVHTQWHAAPRTLELVLARRLGDDLIRRGGGPVGEYKAKNNVCFLFAMVVVWASSFSTGDRCGVFRAVF